MGRGERDPGAGADRTPPASGSTAPATSTPAGRAEPASGTLAELAQGANVAPAQIADQVLETLRAWIVNGRLASGQRLRVREIAALVGTSVMPVREAIRRLEQSGLVVREPYKGAVVRGLTQEELDQAYDVRILLEGTCARLGADAIGAGEIRLMDEHWRELEEAALAGDVHEALEHDEELLATLYSASGNEVALEIIRGLWDRCRPYKVLWASTSEFRGGVRIWHYKPDLIDAARRNDGAAAERILRTSYQEAKRALRLIIERGEEQGP